MFETGGGMGRHRWPMPMPRREGCSVEFLVINLLNGISYGLLLFMLSSA